MLNEVEILHALETETRMMQRQELLKALWRLQNRPDYGDSNNSKDTKAPCEKGDLKIPELEQSELPTMSVAPTGQDTCC